jgi:AcrR family transcriptional regulator
LLRHLASYYDALVRSWIPVPGTTTGRLVEAALELFGEHGYEPVAVAAIAERAGVTTGSLYHHFGSKMGLYRLVRADVEQRVVDRMEGALSTRGARSVADLVPALVVGYDYLVESGYARLLSEPAPDSTDDTNGPDPIQRLIARAIPGDATPVDALVAAAWRAALWHARGGAAEANDARTALTDLLTAARRHRQTASRRR